uniref:J domain-containing protein n=1 Tax=Oryza meridionalis TaxID=40149 RepID=A0A0E0FBY0_9ORYZ
MWRRPGQLRLHLAAAAGAAGRGARRRNPLPPVPTVPSSSSASTTTTRDLAAFARGSSSSRSLSDRAGGGECWSCGASGAFLSCGSCGSVQPVDPAVDYFRIFGLEREYTIKDNNLEGKYKDWQKKLHPDLVHSKSEKERAFAAEQSALVIDAYRTLSKPLSRALYLLQLEGIPIDEEKTITDPELLMEMMEIREAVNDASDSQTLEKIQSQVLLSTIMSWCYFEAKIRLISRLTLCHLYQIKRNLETWSHSFQEAFEKRDFDRAVKATQRMRYYERAVEETIKKL